MSIIKILRLPDGRNLSFAEYGKTDGVPVLYFHGAPSSCLEPLLIGDDIFSSYNLHIICANRPGIGQSDFLENRGFTDFVKDVVFLADHLSLDKFAVLGYSGGSGYAAACAARIPERLTSMVIVSGGWQMTLPQAKDNLKMPTSMFWKIAQRLPFLLPFLLRTMQTKGEITKEKQLEQFKKVMSPFDFEAVRQDDRAVILSKALNEAIANSKGAAWDVRMYVREWDFNPSEVKFPITLFHGAADRNVPVELPQKMVNVLTNAELIIFKNEAHLSAFCNHFDEIAVALLKQ